MQESAQSSWSKSFVALALQSFPLHQYCVYILFIYLSILHRTQKN